MSTIDQILGEFIDAWKAGKRPDVRDYLERAPDQERDELAQQLSTWLEIAPSPAYDDATRAEIAREPALRAALEAGALADQPLTERLPTLRQRAGLALGDVARSVVSAFGLQGQEDRAAEYLERLERDELDAGRMSRRLLDALAGILRVDPVLLVPPRGAPATGQALFRAEMVAEERIEQDIDALSRAALASAPPPMDELDRLFLGGPDA